jgi:hypothetical protein
MEQNEGREELPFGGEENVVLRYLNLTDHSSQKSGGTHIYCLGIWQKRKWPNEEGGKLKYKASNRKIPFPFGTSLGRLSVGGELPPNHPNKIATHIDPLYFVYHLRKSFECELY